MRRKPLPGYLAVLFLTAVPMAANATNGYFPIGFGMKTQAMGGVGIAYPQDANAAGANPAGMALVDPQFNMSMAAFIPPRRVAAEFGYAEFQTPDSTAVTPAPEKSEHNGFPFPGLGMSFELNDRTYVGLTVVGAGANTDYKQNFFQLTGVPPNEPYGPLGVQYFQMQLLPTLAYKPIESQSFGASLALAAHTFRAYGLGNFGTPGTTADFQFSADDRALTNNGPDWGYGAGARLGWIGNFFDEKFSLGAYWASKVYMTKFNRYAGLFAEEGSFDIPQHFGVGVAFRPATNLHIAFDVQQYQYSDVPAIGNRHPTQTLEEVCTRPIGVTCSDPSHVSSTTDQALGGPNSFGFGWRDQTVYKLGGMYRLNKKWSFRGGWNYGESPIPDDQLLFSLLAPAVTEHHVTFGTTYSISRAADIDFTIEYAFKNSQVCAVDDGCVTMLTPFPGGYVAAELEILVIGGGIAYKF